MQSWSVNDSIELYNVNHWSAGFFSINDEGRVVALPDRERNIDLTELAQALKDKNIPYPTLVRFPNILHSRIEKITSSFYEAIEHYQYQGQYSIVYPIKVNQQRRVVEEITGCQPGNPLTVGLEAGSKPELMAVLAMHQSANGIIVCNGYKDREFIHLALMAEKMGHQVFIVVEKLHELNWIIEEAKKIDVRPRIGIRIRLASTCSTHWGNSGGEKSKFGLTTSQLMRAIDRLRELEMIDSLELIHFHLGSQITRIRDIQNSLKECARYYSELHQLNVPVKWVDVGGGLGVDYEGTRCQSAYSANYSISEYANNVVFAFHNICEQHDLPHPNLISESGRAVTAHHAMMIANVFSHGAELLSIEKPNDDSELEILRLWEALQVLESGGGKRSLIELYHDLSDDFNDALSLYTHGQLNLEQRALAENLFLSSCRLLLPKLDNRNRGHRAIIDELNDRLAEKLFVNLSIFQSMPDSWGIDQVFPVIPLQGLDQAPSFRGKIQDVTCDSDGCLYRYVDGQGLESSLPLPPPPPANEDYLMGFFLVGAYQETLGDLHNLFGDTSSVDVYLTDDGFKIDHVLMGDSVQDVLRYVSYNDNELIKRYTDKIAASQLNQDDQKTFLATCMKVLNGYTYLT